MLVASVYYVFNEMLNRSCFRMRALLVYAIAPRNAVTTNFLQQLVARHIPQKVTAFLLPLNLQQRGFESKLLLQKKNAQQTRLNMDKFYTF